jgi:hypothetical protein
MNIILDLSDFQLGYLYFLQPKQNIIMDGTFSKIIYSNEVFSLNSIYLHLPLEIATIERQGSKNIVKLAGDSSFNINTIQQLSKIENRIIEYYKQTHPNKMGKIASCSLYKQLMNGSLKLYKEYNVGNDHLKSSMQFILKISGVWEGPGDIGMTYKIIEHLHP